PHRSNALHGEKVGVGTILVSQRYHKIAEISDITPHVTAYNPPDFEVIKGFFGDHLIQGLVDENKNSCINTVNQKTIIENWPKIRDIIAEIPSAEKLQQL